MSDKVIRPKVIRYRKRIDASAPEGLKKAWDEYQVWQGKRIIGRYDMKVQATRDHPDAIDETKGNHDHEIQSNT